MKMSYTNYREKKEIRDVFSSIRSSLMYEMQTHQKDPVSELFCGDIQIETLDLNPGTNNNDIRLTFLLPIFAVRKSLTSHTITSDEIIEALYDRLDILWDEAQSGIHLTPMVVSGVGTVETCDLESLDHRKKKTVSTKIIADGSIKRCEKDSTCFCGLIEFDGIINMEKIDSFVSDAKRLPMLILRTLAYGEEFFYGIRPIIKNPMKEVVRLTGSGQNTTIAIMDNGTRDNEQLDAEIFVQAVKDIPDQEIASVFEKSIEESRSESVDDSVDDSGFLFEDEYKP